MLICTVRRYDDTRKVTSLIYFSFTKRFLLKNWYLVNKICFFLCVQRVSYNYI